MKYVLAFLAAATPWVLVTVAPSFPLYGEICGESANVAPGCTGYDVLIFIGAKAGDFVDKHEGAITALATVILAIFTWRLWWSTNKLWVEAKTSSATAATAANAAEHANRLNLQAFIADQRPWVSADISLGRDLSEDVNGVNVTLSFVLKNTGKSPALNVWISYEIYPAFGEGVDRIARQRTISDRERQRPVRDGGFGFTLFPGDMIPLHMTTTLAKADIQRWDEFMTNMGAEDFRFLPPICLVGCIDYKTVFDAAHHQTGFILDLHAINENAPGALMAIPRFSGEFPVTKLRLGYSFLGSGITD